MNKYEASNPLYAEKVKTPTIFIKQDTPSVLGFFPLLTAVRNTAKNAK